MQTPEVLALIEWLKNNLTVEVTLDKEYEDASTDLTCRVSLQIDGEEISRSDDSIYLGDS